MIIQTNLMTCINTCIIIIFAFIVNDKIFYNKYINMKDHLAKTITFIIAIYVMMYFIYQMQMTLLMIFILMLSSSIGMYMRFKIINIEFKYHLVYINSILIIMYIIAFICSNLF
jgi:hypothetical protein